MTISSFYCLHQMQVMLTIFFGVEMVTHDDDDHPHLRSYHTLDRTSHTLVVWDFFWLGAQDIQNDNTVYIHHI